MSIKKIIQNKKLTFTLTVFLAVFCFSNAKISLATNCSTYGNRTYCDDGTTYETYGNRTYGSDGSNYETYGNRTYGSDGTNYETYGNRTYGSDGTNYETYGNRTYGSDGSTYETYGNTTYGNGNGKMITTCPINSSYDSATAKCKCNSGYKSNGSSCVYDNSYETTPACPINSYYDNISVTCKCNYGYISNGSSCVYKGADYSNNQVAPENTTPDTVIGNEVTTPEPSSEAAQENEQVASDPVLFQNQDIDSNNQTEQDSLMNSQVQNKNKSFTWWNPLSWWGYFKS